MASPGEHLPLDDERLGKAFDRKLSLRLLRYALPYRGIMAAVVALILTIAALDLVGPFIVKWAIDGPLRQAISAGASGGTAGAPAGGAERELLVPVAAYLGTIAILLSLRYLQGVSMAAIGQRVMRDLRMDLFRHLQRLPVAFYDRTAVGRLTNRVTSDIESLNQLFTSGVVTFVADILVLVGITAALLWINASLALVTLAALPPLLAVTSVFRRSAQKHYRETRRHLARLSGFAQESVQGMTVIQLFTRERENARQYREINRSYLDAFQRTVFCYALYFPAVEAIAAAALAAILWRGGAGILEGTLSFGEFFLFWSFLGRFMSPVRDMAERYNVLQSAMAAAERIFKVMDEPAGPGTPGAPASTAAHSAPVAPAGAAAPAVPALLPPRFRGEVEFRDVWFGYERKGADFRWALRGVSFRVAPGETVAVVGATGAGKTTLASLLARFHEPQRGRILVDGRDIAEYPLDEYRRRIGVVLQDPFLFSRTVRENIQLGRRGISLDAVGAAARRANADRFIERLPGGFEAVLGERGAGLSAGEKQLLTFARALAHDPDILILDEATSSVDAATEALIRAAVGELLSGRTAIVIAHRLSTIREANRIIAIHKGEVREVGTHRQLMARRGIYFRLYRLQMDAGSLAGAAERSGAGAEAGVGTEPMGEPEAGVGADRDPLEGETQ